MMCVCADVDDGDANFIVTGWGNETRIKFQFHSIEFSTASPVPLHVLENPERSRSFLDKETGSWPRCCTVCPSCFRLSCPCPPTAESCIPILYQSKYDTTDPFFHLICYYYNKLLSGISYSILWKCLPRKIKRMKRKTSVLWEPRALVVLKVSCLLCRSDDGISPTSFNHRYPNSRSLLQSTWLPFYSSVWLEFSCSHTANTRFFSFIFSHVYVNQILFFQHPYHGICRASFFVN